MFFKLISDYHFNCFDDFYEFAHILFGLRIFHISMTLPNVFLNFKNLKSSFKKKDLRGEKFDIHNISKQVQSSQI